MWLVVVVAVQVMVVVDILEVVDILAIVFPLKDLDIVGMEQQVAIQLIVMEQLIVT